MRRPMLAALALLGTAGAAGYREFSYADVGGHWRPVAAWCDTPGRVLAITAPRGQGAVRPATLVQWTGGRLSARTWQYGPGEGAAGSSYVALTPAGQQVSDDPTYYVHTSNVENVQDPAYRLTRVVEFRVPAGTFRCRYVPQAAVLAATAKHSVVVWEQGGKVTYASRNRDGTAGVQLTGGTHTQGAGGDEYQWRRGGYTYALEVGRDGAAGGRLSVSRGGRLLSREALLAYSVSVSR
ncbi:hypothetical protein [Deinococcus petrolearius]|uniref:Uncharacterized protein n=1 Tax=Deinococcus petrolearius TaxID=1751295 RepID=A0ABW1DI96_9DEIO